jgi:voltage-gated potassium channel
MQEDSTELKNSTYELFVAALSILSIANLILRYLIPSRDLDTVVAVMDGILSIVFLADFLHRLFTARSKSRYFFRQFGWADLLASLPFPRLKLLRLFRIFRAARLLRRYGVRRMVHEFVSNRAGSALFSLLFFIFLVLEFGGLAILSIERQSPEANIKNASDALWYTFVTITTVGYGDRYPVTDAGRLIGLLVMTAGVGLFGTFTGFLANAFLGPRKEESPAPSGPAEAASALAEIRNLLAEQKAGQAQLLERLAEIEQRLASGGS